MLREEFPDLLVDGAVLWDEVLLLFPFVPRERRSVHEQFFYKCYFAQCNRVVQCIVLIVVLVRNTVASLRSSP